jgi:hypothetical protein
LNIRAASDIFTSIEHDRERITMLQRYRNLTGFAALVLVGVYSAVMMATSGSAAWAWLILVAAVVLLVVAARGGFTAKDERQDG